jgi:hypothetical protein
VTDPAGPHIVAGSPTDDENAAIAAVFAQLLVERAAVATPIHQERTRSAWERSRRPLRRQVDGVERHWNDIHGP